MRSGRLAGGAYVGARRIAAVNVFNAYRPLAWTGGGSVASFFAGFATSEVPRASLGLVAAETAAALARGAHRPPAGKLGLGLSAASAAALVALERRAKPAE